ncbi:hypothetical protein [Sphingosinithalassobacter sp. CS137]|uniref:hypothetical protein n=1 Tax=Sphingosinithalassobacter sp. CS137 TaxID=2762748 RepID=UPI00165D36E0|nr:hypothetical protein [Sphingosinithalassobacter sp. CS137]
MAVVLRLVADADPGVPSRFFDLMQAQQRFPTGFHMDREADTLVITAHFAAGAELPPSLLPRLRQMTGIRSASLGEMA